MMLFIQKIMNTYVYGTKSEYIHPRLAKADVARCIVNVISESNICSPFLLDNF